MKMKTVENEWKNEKVRKVFKKRMEVGDMKTASGLLTLENSIKNRSSCQGRALSQPNLYDSLLFIEHEWRQPATDGS